MRYPLDELIDKKSIIRLKIERIEDEEDKKMLKKEYQDYAAAVEEYISDGICTISQVENWYKKLYQFNGNTWDLEVNIRKGQIGEMSLEEIGRTAILIRESNRERIRIKSMIVEGIGSGYKDIKINHASLKSDK